MNERELENIICKYPELIENNLLFIGRQITVKGKRIDVLFKDRHGNDLILEIKRGTVIREHCSQLFDYEGFFVSDNNPNVRVMLVGNRVPENLRRSLNHHGFEWKELPIDAIQVFLSTKSDADSLKCLLPEVSLHMAPTVSVKRTGVMRTNVDQIYIDFWNRLKELALQRGSNLQFRVNNSQYQWYRDIGIGYPGVHICLTIQKSSSEVTCELQIPKSPELYDWLHIREAELIRLLNCQPVWIAKPRQNMRRIRISREADILELEVSAWESHQDWLLQTAECFQQAFLGLLHQRE